MTEPIDISDDVDAMSHERKVVAFKRAERALGRDVEDEDLEVGTEFADLMHTELVNMVIGDYLNDAQKDGVVSTTVADNGDLEYTLTEDGEDATE